MIPDVAPPGRTKIERVLLCSGKIYYELEQKRADLKRDNVAIVRVEQLYPLPKEPLKAALADCADGTPVFWVQEEPENMGAWRFLRGNFGDRLFDRLPLAGIYRQSAASPATGSASSHRWSRSNCWSRRLGKVSSRLFRHNTQPPPKRPNAVLGGGIRRALHSSFMYAEWCS